MSSSEYLSEVFRIVEGALRQDGVKVRNYSALLAEKLASNGEQSSALRLRKLIDERSVQLHPARVEYTPPPVDSESRFPLLEKVVVPESVENHLFTLGERAFVDDYLSVARARFELERRGIKSGTNLLLYGPPGCGKSHLAGYISRQLCRPMFVARLDGLISSFLGSTAKNIRAVFEFAARTPCVLLLDEFDAIAKMRDDQQELGELKRVVNSFIQNIDSLGKDVVLIAATNHENLLDPAVWRRFQYLLHINQPDRDQREAFWRLFSGDLNWTPKELKALADLSEGVSAAAIEGAATRVRQQVVTRGIKPTLHLAVSALVSLARGEAGGSSVLASMRLDEPKMLARQLKKRSPRLYSLSLVGEIAGVSKATMSRQASIPRRKGH